MAGKALVIEGGGMKGAYANGVLTAFERAKHAPWDAVYGASAGGALAAWYVAGQAEYAEGTWEYAADRRILSYRRFLRGGPLLDHEALLEIVYQDERALDEAAVHRCPFPAIVVCSRIKDGGATYHDLRQGPVIPWLKATGRLPFAAGPPVRIEGLDYLDGGIVDPIPVAKAVRDGHTDITLILNRPAGPLPGDNRLLSRWTAARFPALRDKILHHRDIKEAAIRYAESPPPGVRVRIIRPAAPTGLHRLSRDLKAIRAGLLLGRADGETYLRQQTPGM